MTQRTEDTQVIAGQATFVGTGNPTLGAATVGDTQVASGANVSAAKLQHQHELHYSIPIATLVAAETRILHIARGVGVVVAVEATIAVTPVGGTEGGTIDLQKSTAGGAPATVLTAPIAYITGTTVRTVLPGSLGSTPDITLADGDLLFLVIAISGTGGTQAKGLAVTVTIREVA